MAVAKKTRKVNYGPNENTNVNTLLSGRTKQVRVGNMTTRTERTGGGVYQSATQVKGKNGVAFVKGKKRGEKQVKGHVRVKKSAMRIAKQMKRIEENRANSGLSGARIQKALDAGKAGLAYRALAIK